jgi:hypothetical protein
MSVAEIKEQISQLSPAQRKEIAAQLEAMKAFDDPEHMKELAQRRREIEEGVNVLTKEQMLERLRAAGVNV